MNEESLKDNLKYNVSAVFTFFNLPLHIKKNIMDNLKDVYSYNIDEICEESGGLNENYLYFLFNYDDEVDEELNKLEYIDKIYLEDYILLKCDKWAYMSKEEWELMQDSQYNKFKDIIYVNALRDASGTLQYSIITEDMRLKVLLADCCNIDVKDVNICWKAFSYDEEVLDLSKIVDMTMLTYKKSWLIEQMNKAVLHEKFIYQKVLDNSVEIVSLGTTKQEFHYEETYIKLKARLKEICGAEQYRVEIKGTKFSLLPGLKDFKDKLSKCIKRYDLDDYGKIEKCLLAHISTLKAPLMKYYILKDNESALVSDYESYEEEKEIVNVDTKSLF